MQDLFTSFFVILITILMITAIFAFIKLNQDKKEKLIRNLVDSRGWKYQKIHQGSANGYSLQFHNWSLEVITSSEGIPNANGHSLWWAANTHPEKGILLIGPKPAKNNLGNVNGLLMQKAATLFLGEMAEGLKEVSIGSNIFDQKYMLLSNSDSTAKELITTTLERELIEWPVKLLPIIKVLPERISIEIPGYHIQRPEEIEAIIHIGEILLINLQD
ncbi:MAG: hypothetical protein ACYDH1_14810 [Anaerolineaceae bacterium]